MLSQSKGCDLRHPITLEALMEGCASSLRLQTEAMAYFLLLSPQKQPAPSLAPLAEGGRGLDKCVLTNRLPPPEGMGVATLHLLPVLRPPIPLSPADLCLSLASPTPRHGLFDTDLALSVLAIPTTWPDSLVPPASRRGRQGFQSESWEPSWKPGHWLSLPGCVTSGK